MPKTSFRFPPLARESAQNALVREAGTIGRLAIASLFREVALENKPGLVGPSDPGSHSDMDFRTFIRSLQALRAYFPAIAVCGAGEPTFASLQCLGLKAEAAMLAATGGINTHRGAIFNLGLLCAAAGLLRARGTSLEAEEIAQVVSRRWGRDILRAGRESVLPSHGAEVARRYGSGGARQEAAAGFPAVLRVGLPAYRAARAAGKADGVASLHTLLTLIAEVEDTNLLWRGGRSGLHFAQSEAKRFLVAGGTDAPDWQDSVTALHRQFVKRRLSPGGSADLLGIVLFLDALERT